MVLSKKKRRKSQKQKKKSKLRKKEFVKQKLINLKITNWYRKSNIKKLERYFFNLWGDILAAKKYTHLFLKYYIPTSLNKIKSNYNDYGSNIMVYRYNQNKWLDDALIYYQNIYLDNQNNPDKLEELQLKIKEMFKLYQLFENKITYKNYIDNLYNKFTNITNQEKPSLKQLIYILVCLLSFEIQETLKAKTTMKFFTFLTEINNVIQFLNELSVKKNNPKYYNHNYYNRASVYNRFIFPFFVSLCELTYFNNEDIESIVRSINQESPNSVKDFAIFCPDTLYNLLDCHPKVLCFHNTQGETTNIFIAIRGTTNITEISYDLVINRINTEFGYLHSGFYTIYNGRVKINLLDYLTRIRQQCKKTINFYVTGHSLGAALAVISSLDIKNIAKSVFSDDYHINTVRLFTFSCPYVGSFNKEYSDNKYIDLNFHIHNNDIDPVCCYQDATNILPPTIKDLTDNFLVNTFLTRMTRFVVPSHYKKSASYYPTNELFYNQIKKQIKGKNNTSNQDEMMVFPNKEFIQSLNQSINMQYSYNINTSTYNQVLAKFNLTKSDSHTFHGTFRFEENGELYSLMGGYSGYFTILAKNLEEENPIFDLTSVKYKRNLPDINENQNKNYDNLLENLTIEQKQYKIKTTYL